MTTDHIPYGTAGPHTIPPARSMPLKVASISIKDDPAGQVFVYELERDPQQEFLLNKAWHIKRGLSTENHDCSTEHPDTPTQWIANNPTSFVTRTPLNITPGEYFTLDLVPWEPYEVPEEMRQQSSLIDLLRRLME